MKRLFVAIVFVILLIVSCTPQPKPMGWSLLNPSISPPPLTHSGFAYNTNSKEAIIFGGVTKDIWSDETWIWNGDGWQQANSPTNPSAREKVAMAYDEARDKVILFGGVMHNNVYNETWEWNGSSWQLMNPAHNPPPRCCHTMAYDNIQEKVLLYGGWNHLTGEFYSDTWAWDGQDWVELTCCNVPPASAHTLLNFSGRNEIIALSSVEDAGAWIWDGERWNNPAIDLPAARQDGRIAYDNIHERAIFFGGIHENEFLNDTWIFDGQNWSLLNMPSQPAARYGHIMFYDRNRQSIILFGGTGSEGLFRDTWELNLNEDISDFISEAAD